MGIYDALFTSDIIICNLIYVKFVEAVGIVTITASVANLAIITLDRYIAIVHALRYTSIVTFGRTVHALLLAWVFSMVFGIGLSVVSSLYRELYSVLRLVWYSYLLAVSFAIVGLYIKLHRISRDHAQRILANSAQGVSNTRSERRGLATVSMVLIVLVVCFIPYTAVRSVMRMQITSSPILSVARMITFTILLSNAMANPLVYFFRSRNLRSFSYKMLHSMITKLLLKRCN